METTRSLRGGDVPGLREQHVSTMALNIGLIVGVAGGVAVLLLIAALALHRRRSTSEAKTAGAGGTSVGGKGGYQSCNTLPSPTLLLHSATASPHTAQLALLPPTGQTDSAAATTQPARREVKEWYV